MDWALAEGEGVLFSFSICHLLPHLLAAIAPLPHAGSSAWATSTGQPCGHGSVRTWGGSGMLPSLQGDRQACCGFMDAGARPEAPGSEIKDFISQSNKSQKAVGGGVREL